MFGTSGVRGPVGEAIIPELAASTATGGHAVPGEMVLSDVECRSPT